MFVLKFTNQFLKDAKLITKRSSKSALLLSGFLGELAINGAAGLDRKYLAHKLSGKYNNNWEAHIKPDLLIIWFEVTADNEILLLRTGSHSDFF